MKAIYVFIFFIFFFGLASAQETIFSDNFNDGSITDWNQFAGTWSAASLQLVGGNADGGTIAHDVNMTVAGDFNITFKQNPGAVGLVTDFAWFIGDGNTSIANFTGYRFVMTTTGISLRKQMGSGGGTILITSTEAVGIVDHNIAIYHRSDGNISLWMDGVPKGSVVDTTYSSSKRILIGTENAVDNGTWDNILITRNNIDTNFYVVDEEVPTNPLTGATITINGSAWPQNPNGSFDINSSVSFPATIQISKTGYDTRSFVFDTNASLYDSPNRLGLRVEDESKDILFQFFAPDEETILSSRWINATRTAFSTTVLSGRNQTSSNGIISFNLAPQDSLYNFDIFTSGTSSGDANVQYTYGSVTVTVNAPKNELTNTNVNSPSGFNLDVGGPGLQNISAQTSFPFSTIFILGNTEDVYSLRVVDNNSDGQQYFPRLYVLHAKGDESAISITPYLIPIADGITTNIIVKNISNEITIPGIRIQAKVGIGNALVVVEDQITNATGASSFTFQSKKPYEVSITSPNQDINYFSGTFSTTHSSFTVWINFDTTDFGGTAKDINVSWTPTSPFVSGTNQIVSANVSANFPISYIQIYGLDFNQTIDSNVLLNEPFLIDLNLNLNNYDNNSVLVRLDVVPVVGQNFSYFQNFIISGKPRDVIESLQGLRNIFTPVSLFVIVSIIILGGISVLGNSIFGSNESQVFFVGLLGSILFFIFFFEEIYIKVLLAAMFIGGAAWLWSRSIR